MSLIKPANYAIPSTVTNLERQITHHILVASRIYQGQLILEESTISRPACEYFLFEAASGELRFGFRGSFELDRAYTAANTENKDFWEYIEEIGQVNLPVAYYQAS
jgi:hypothetical protein